MNEIESVVDYIIKKGKCMRCGGCVAVCPQQILKIRYNKKTGFYDVIMDGKQCCKCGKCIKVCPAATNESSEKYIGKYKKIYLTSSVNQNIRINATSGGSINEICRYLLEKKKVDKILLVKNEPDAKMLAKAKFVESEEELLENPRQFASRYVSIPLCSLLKNVDKNKKYAVIGTPCQIISARRILGRDNIYLGIACSEGISFKATEKYLKELELKQIENIFYRGGGWPGRTTVFTHDGEIIEQEHYNSDFNAIYSSQIYRNKGCRFCHDQFANEADISFFDFWNVLEVKNEKFGKSGTIVRTEIGEKLLEKLEEEKRIYIEETLDEKRVIDSQEWILLLKEKYWNHWTIKIYYLFINIFRLSIIEYILPISFYRFFSKNFRRWIYLLKRIERVK
ncbi:Coenzyme F420 hydrogenase/dehydrogenase, beta subunit C-terminal domain [[Clostridium] symbiosum]|uniref:4Fe-4S binding domain protein n=1 Tax=[Clostridium] symbiosum ATCC 14940 TaxID=411472 RepID=A0ABC9TYF1_CLOSY|nr:Coenzyme F420 hydrogenase/dehydrogenase, beta subunit C-terminal domain [[Clostridium] symbiosum]ERI77198.1 4Fe-4S binding domain protein [[Clostridium] symbiosum ATCC 14940]MDB2036913.1 Coenzyme F420 hydrogenase/dehydrogenase, beta subunit C-terminal domain [[Clostridium] symbiosum]MDM8136501.1 Coenzyme F420 hydrogenase/dehydrogenase, beta subunit C-terminal domain [[Clostridium] symbiosum]MDM8141329.1 Coenzyme F420 hydrogenase/dehydrogenase, beta subunit C-terminal domain [[Clostridium] sy